MTSLEQLRAALEDLTRLHDIDCRYFAGSLSELFAKSNTKLSTGWERIYGFLNQVQATVINEFSDMYKQLNVYIEQSEGNEAQEQRAIDEANAQAEMILKELGIN